MKEALLAVAKVFQNPLFYWIFILIIFTGIRRIKLERKHFGIKINDLFSEWSRTWLLTIGFGFILSALMLGVGVVFTYETMFVLSIVTIVLSIHGKPTWLSATYTVGLTYLIMLLAPLVLPYQDVISLDLIDEVNFTAIALLVALFL